MGSEKFQDLLTAQHQHHLVHLCFLIVWKLVYIEYLKLSSKKQQQQQQRKEDDSAKVSSNEVQDFLEQLQSNPDFEMDEDLEDLVKNTEDKDAVDGDEEADGDDDDDEEVNEDENKDDDDDKPIAYGDDSDDDDEVKLNQIIADESKADHFDQFVENKQPLTKELIAAWIHAIKTVRCYCFFILFEVSKSCFLYNVYNN